MVSLHDIHRITERDSEILSDDVAIQVLSRTMLGGQEYHFIVVTNAYSQRCWTRNAFNHCTYRGGPVDKERKNLPQHRLFNDPPVYAITLCSTSSNFNYLMRDSKLRRFRTHDLDARFRE